MREKRKGIVFYGVAIASGFLALALLALCAMATSVTAKQLCEPHTQTDTIQARFRAWRTVRFKLRWKDKWRRAGWTLRRPMR